jgi:F-type H+-transporting ATPase subunit b
MELDIKQIISQIIAFLLILWVLKRFAWRPLLNIMAEREKLIVDQFESIEEAKKEVNDLRANYERMVKEIDNEAKVRFQRILKEGNAAAQEIQQSARKQSQEMLAQAQREIQREVVQAKQQLKNEVVNLTMAATGKILKDHVDEEQQRKLVTDFISKVEIQ